MPKKQQNPLKKWYNGLASGIQAEVRQAIMEDCEIQSKTTFYNYINGVTKPSKLEKMAICRISGKKMKTLFPNN